MNHKTKAYQLLSNINELKWNLAFKGIIVGVIAGLLVVLYRLGIGYGTQKALEGYAYLKGNFVYIVIASVAAILIGYIVHKLVEWEPFAKGSGIPQVEGIVLLGMKMKWYSVLLVRFVAGIATSFFGVSMGREGPSIQVGACGSQLVSEKLGKSKLEDNYLITAGASAGLSAAFNAPLSGIIFALEEVHRSFSPNLLIAVTTASLTADMVSKYAFGLDTALHFKEVLQLNLGLYIWLPVIGVFAGLIGAITNQLLLAAGMLYKKFPASFRPIIALLIAIPCGLYLPEVLGGGDHLIELSQTAKIGIGLMSLFLVFKILFTATSFGSGIPGGIFMPVLAIGATSGNVLAWLASYVGLPQEYFSVFCICAMAGVLSATVKAPITSILLMAEMTGSLVHLLPVAAVAFIALFTSDALKIPPIYEILLERLAFKKRHEGQVRRKSSILEIAVEMGSDVAGKKVKDITWPKGSLIVSLRRGEQEFVPNGDTEIMQGDYLVIVSSGQKYEEMQIDFTKMCHIER